MEINLPPNLRISTITATSKINSTIDLNKVYNFLTTNENFKYIEFGNNPSKGTSQKNVSQKKKDKKKVFFNQITVEVEHKNVINNIKLFNNGSISMTGVKNIETGKGAIILLFDYLKKETSIFENNNPEIMFFKIVLINSDFKFDFEIKRSELHQILVNDYKIYSSYEPCIYPGVNSKYYWNSKYQNKTVKALDCSISNRCCSITYDINSVDIPKKIKEYLNSYQFKEKYSFYLNNIIELNYKYLEFDFENNNLTLDIYLNEDNEDNENSINDKIKNNLELEKNITTKVLVIVRVL